MYTKWTPNINNGSQDTEKVSGEQRRKAGTLCISSGILEKDNKRGKRGILYCCYFFFIMHSIIHK